MSEKLFSHHIFIFPFKWDCGSPDDSFVSRTHFGDLDKKMKTHPNCSSEKLNPIVWRPFTFEILSPKDYNEWCYFYPPVREVLFARGNGKKIVRQYHIHKSENQQYLELRIVLKPELGCTVLQLEIEEVTLTFYETGIGFLAFHLNNYQHDSEEEILKINDFGRRLYPQFLGTDGALTSATKEVFLADSISIYSNHNLLIEENFRKFDTLEHNYKETLPAEELSERKHNELMSGMTPAHVRAFLPGLLKFSGEKAESGDILIESLVDDRMFTICWVGHDKWAKQLNALNFDNAKYHHAKLWHRLIFLDGKSPGLANNQFLSELNATHTNPRWADYGTLYGITRYSFVALTDSDFGKKLVLPHIQSMYFQIAMLCLLQRASTLRFSEEIAHLVSNPEQRGYLSHARDLYAKYLHFINKIYFREVTPHEQGIELYRMVQEKMEIPRDVESLKAEIAEFHQLLELENANAQTGAMNTLTIVGSALLVPSLILAYYGISAYAQLDDNEKSWFTFDWTWKVAFAGMVVGFFSAWLWVYARNSKYRIWAGVTAVILVLCVLAATVIGPKIWF